MYPPDKFSETHASKTWDRPLANQAGFENRRVPGRYSHTFHFVENIMKVIIASDQQGAVLRIANEDVDSFLRTQGIACGQNCDGCPNAVEGCGAPTEGAGAAVNPTIH